MYSKVVISQPMFLPWRGIFEQLKHCDVFVHYDDVQFPRGRSFINRVQIKTKDGIKWLTVPVDKKNSGIKINETLIAYDKNWQDKHLSTIRHAFAGAKYKNDVLTLAETIYAKKYETLAQFNINSFEMVAKYFGIERKYFLSSEMSIAGSSSQRLLDIVVKLGGTQYITGLGALNYIDYDLFENEGVSLEYMGYNNTPYKQLFSDFTPYVTILDLIANEGKMGIEYIDSASIYWKDFISE